MKGKKDKKAVHPSDNHALLDIKTEIAIAKYENATPATHKKQDRPKR